MCWCRGQDRTQPAGSERLVSHGFSFKLILPGSARCHPDKHIKPWKGFILIIMSKYILTHRREVVEFLLLRPLPRRIPLGNVNTGTVALGKETEISRSETIAVSQLHEKETNLSFSEHTGHLRCALPACIDICCTQEWWKRRPQQGLIRHLRNTGS